MRDRLTVFALAAVAGVLVEYFGTAWLTRSGPGLIGTFAIAVSSIPLGAAGAALGVRVPWLALVGIVASYAGTAAALTASTPPIPNAWALAFAWLPIIGLPQVAIAGFLAWFVTGAALAASKRRSR